MAEMFDRMELTGLRKAHMRQLLWYLEDRDHDRRYAGNREQFEQRHHELKEWLKAANDTSACDKIEELDDPKKYIEKVRNKKPRHF